MLSIHDCKATVHYLILEYQLLLFIVVTLLLSRNDVMISIG